VGPASRCCAIVKDMCAFNWTVCVCVCNCEFTLARMTSRKKSNMGENVEEVLRNTLRVLCSNTIPYNSQISIDAMVGITINNSEVILVNVHEQLVLLDKSAVTQASSSGGGSVFGQGSVKSQSFDGTVTVSQHHQQFDNFNTTAADSSEYAVSGRVAYENAGFGSSARHFYDDVVDASEAGGGGDELEIYVEKREYPDDNAAECGDDCLNDYDMAGTDVADGGLYSIDVKPFSMVASGSGEDSIHIPVSKAVAPSSFCGRGKRGMAHMSSDRKKRSTPRTKHTEKAEAVGLPSPRVVLSSNFGEKRGAAQMSGSRKKPGTPQMKRKKKAKAMGPSLTTKAFQCTICDHAQFIFRSSWRRHLLLKHKQNPDGSAADPALIQRYAKYGQNRSVDKQRRAMLCA